MRERTEITRPKGINKDLSPYELPPEVWSDGGNINFRRLRTNSSTGYSNAFTLTDTGIQPLYVQYFTDNVDNFWVYVDEDKVYKTVGSTADQLIQPVLTATDADTTWSGCNFNGMIVLNNRLNPPLILPETSTSLNTGYSEVEVMPNWAVPDSGDPELDIWGIESRCEVMRPYKNYLMAMDCYDDSQIRYPSMIRWSSPADAGDVPPSWDPYKAGEQAGLYNIADTPGRIVDGLTLGDYFVVYKTDSVWLIDFIGGDSIFRFRKLYGDDTGALSKDCIAEFDGKHFVLSPTGAYIHNASSKTEIMEKWVKDKFFDEVDPDKLYNTKVVPDHNNKEVWIYYTSQGSLTGWADVALIWNWEIQEWTVKDLSGISHIAQGYVDPTNISVDSWDSDETPPGGPDPVPNPGSEWNSSTTTWNSGGITFNKGTESLLLADYVNSLFYTNDYTEGTSVWMPKAWVERIGIDFGDDRRFKYITRIVPHILGQNPITIKVYTSEVQTPDPLLQAQVTYNPLEDEDVDIHVSGRYVGIRFESDDLWTLTGYTIEWEPTGKF